MTSTINASTTSGVVTSADNSGVLQLQGNGAGGIAVNTSGAVGVGTTPSYGTSGYYLQSAGSSAPATWSLVSLTAGVTGTLPIANGGTGSTSTTYCSLTTNVTGVLPVANGGTNNQYFTVSGPATSAKTYTFPNANMSVGYLNLPAVGTKTGSYTLATADVGKYVQVGTGGSITIPDATFAEGDVIVIANNTTGAITITCTITTAYIAGTDTDKASVSLATRGVANILFLSGTVCIITGNVS